jgi:hypothetical protein
MSHHERPNGTPTLIELIHEYHVLRAKDGTAEGLAPKEETLLALLGELFEPLRVASHGLRRTPISLNVSRSAVIFTQGGAHRTTVVRVALRRVWVETTLFLPLGSDVILSIATGTGRFCGFRGRAARAYPLSRIATIDLIAAQGSYVWTDEDVPSLPGSGSGSGSGHGAGGSRSG